MQGKRSEEDLGQRDINRQAMKAAYQPNLLKAMLVVASIVVVSSLWLELSNNQNERNLVTVRTKNARLRPSSFAVPESESTQRYFVGGTQEQGLRGQFGIDVRISSELPSPFSTPKHVPQVPIIQELVTIVDISTSATDMSEGNAGPYIPVETEFVPLPESMVVGPIVVQCSVTVYVEPQYPMVARHADKEGVARLIVFVDTLGNVTLFPEDIMRHLDTLVIKTMTARVGGEKRHFNYIVDYEEPADYFFATNIASVLGSWRFRPASRNGLPINELLVVSYAFCLTGECNKVYTQIGQYIRQ